MTPSEPNKIPTVKIYPTSWTWVCPDCNGINKEYEKKHVYQCWKCDKKVKPKEADQ